jgi:hypothetical protein
MKYFIDYLEFALKNFNEKSLLKVSVVTTGDIAKSIKSNFKDYSHKIIKILIEILMVTIFFYA